MADRKGLFFDFQTAAYPAEKWGVVRFSGRESISHLFFFEIDLVSEDATIDAEKIVNQPASLIMDSDGDLSHVNGIIVRFEQGDRGPEFVNYHAVLAPPLYRLSLNRRSQVFLDKNVETIVDEVLKDNGLSRGKDYDFTLTGTHPTHEYVVQYEESDLNFIQRWMEHEGIFYFFDHDGQDIKLVIADTPKIHKPIKGEPTVPFRDARSVNPAGEAVGRLTFTRSIVPGGVLLKDYNYRKPTLEVKGESAAVDKGVGTVVEYGNHFKDPETGQKLAVVRAQEIACREKVFTGHGSHRHFRSGFTFTLSDHFVAGNNQEYLLTEIDHHAEQLGVVGTASGGQPGQPSYTNDFRAIASAVPFRPERVTHKPRITGIMHATIDGSTSGQYAEIDDMGRYKVKLPFDLSGRSGGKASRFIRMAQAYSGPAYGMHFPLHKDTEVMLVHVDGDPDRPIIAGTVPNPANASPVTGGNHTQCRIRTGSDNEILIEDTAGSEYVKIRTPNQNSFLSMGAAHNPPPGITMGTEHGISVNAGKGITISAGSPDHTNGVSTQGANGGKVAGVAATVAGAAALAGGVGADLFAAGLAKAAPSLVGDLAGFVAGVTLPGVYVTAPGKVGITAVGEVVMGAIGSADIVALGPANVLSVAGAMIAGIKGAAVIAVGKVEMISAMSDVLIEAKKRGNVIIEAKKSVDIEAKTKDVKVEAEENFFLKTHTKNIEMLGWADVKIESKDTKKIVLTAGKSSITMTNDKITLRADLIEFKSNDKKGAIEIGKTVLGESVILQGVDGVLIDSHKYIDVSASNVITLKSTGDKIKVVSKEFDAKKSGKCLWPQHDDSA